MGSLFVLLILPLPLSVQTEYLGELSENPYAPDSTANPFGAGSPFNPEHFSHDDILLGRKDGSHTAFLQVKPGHPDRLSTFILRETEESWATAPQNQ